MSHSAAQSSVGKGAFYEAGDQRNLPQSAIKEQQQYEQGEKGSHSTLDSSMFLHQHEFSKWRKQELTAIAL